MAERDEKTSKTIIVLGPHHGILSKPPPTNQEKWGPLLIKKEYREKEVKGWLCKFLNKPNPNIPFPYKKNAYPYPNYDRLKRMAIREPKKFFGW